MRRKTGGKSVFKKVWYFIWEDDSILSWVVNIILAYLLIKFIVYPGLGLVLGTTHPVVAVVSGSMEHCLRNNMICGQLPPQYVNSYDAWWDTCGSFYSKYNISKTDFNDYPFKNGFNTGDLMILVGKEPEKLNKGDVIVFLANRPDPIIHRIIEKREVDGKYYFETKGDHNSNIGDVDKNISEDNIIGKALIRVPLLGYIKIGFVKLLDIMGIYNPLVRYGVFS
ncbi:signal peptidase I [Candidatus Woesearchaeota archaeon]|nr:signal peptidase I [Candidatus Woesearchaeota archaeon]